MTFTRRVLGTGFHWSCRAATLHEDKRVDQINVEVLRTGTSFAGNHDLGLIRRVGHVEPVRYALVENSGPEIADYYRKAGEVIG